MTTDPDVGHELKLSNVGCTNGIVDDTPNASYGHGLCQNAMNDVSTSASSNNEDQEDLPQHQYNDFIALKKIRKGLIFRLINKKKDDGLFYASVKVDNIDFFGKGQTRKEANNDCASKVLSAIDSQKNAFTKLKGMYSGLVYQTLPNLNDRYDVCVDVDGIEYYGNGKTNKEANDEAAWAALQSITSGAHKKKLQENKEYWYDEENIFVEYSGNCHSDCRCPFCPYY